MRVKTVMTLVLAALFLGPALVRAADYVIDTKGAHAFVQFRIKHLGYSWLYGRFNELSGGFSYDDADPGAAKAEIVVKTESIDTNHAERDKHLRSEDFLDVRAYPEATFVSTAYEPVGAGRGRLKGDLTLHGVTRPIVVDVARVGQGPDPWGGYRLGVEGKTTIKLADFGIDYDLGPASRELELFFSLEGIRQ